MGPTDQECAIIWRIFDLDVHGTNQTFDHILENPVPNYTDPGHFHREIEVLFHQLPTAIARRSQLANPDDFLTRGETGVPILVAIGRGFSKASPPRRTSTSPSADASEDSTSTSTQSTPHWPAN